ncbi:PACE efflux transporter [Alcaligenaceae bacterium]|nr:PACE efflux transporter [Alcaligenaceae bacterium]
MFTLSPIKRRIVYVSVFEIIAIILSTLFLMTLSGTDAKSSLPIAIIVSIAAVVWNYIYNTAFESWEQRKNIKVRTLLIRTSHACGFEGGLVLICLPVYMLWYNVGLWKAFTMELALLLFFLVYTFVFTLIFDKIFTLPQHSSPQNTIVTFPEQIK